MDKWSPEYWFLAEGETIAVRLGDDKPFDYVASNQLLTERFEGWKKKNLVWQVPNAEEHLLKPYTGNNEVKALIDGENYMDDLHQELTGLTKGCFVLIAGWEFGGRKKQNAVEPYGHVNLVKNKPISAIDDVLLRLMNRGIQVRLLAFKNIVPFIDNDLLVKKLNTVADLDSQGKRPPCAFLDAVLPGTAMAHHEKLVYLEGFRDGPNAYHGPVAYVGGIDLAFDRRDDVKHAGAKEKFKGMFAWHDIQLKIEGPATAQIWANFAERWDGYVPKKDLARCPVPRLPRDKRGNKYVQVLRTVARAPISYSDRYMPDGERTVLCGLAKAISRAERYIYIEDQYLWDCELADFIWRQMCVKPGLHLIVVLPGLCELPARLRIAHDHLRNTFFRRVMGVHRKDGIIEFGDKHRVYAYKLRQEESKNKPEPIYVHSKLIIIDDRYVAVGSANVDQRSMHLDTELHLGIVDGHMKIVTWDGQKTKVCAFAKQLREALWTEHLHLKLPDEYHFDEDPITEFKKSFPQKFGQADYEQRHHVRRYMVHRHLYEGPITGSFTRMLDRREPQWLYIGKYEERVPLHSLLAKMYIKSKNEDRL